MYTEPRVLYALEATSAVIEVSQAGEITQASEQLAGNTFSHKVFKLLCHLAMHP